VRFACLRIRPGVPALVPVPLLITLLSETTAGELTLTWTDTSTDNTGVAIERSIGSADSFSQIATTGAGATTYTDSTVAADATTYCYRVRAFNAGGYSDYSNTACASVQPAASVVVVSSGTGGGTVTSSPAGIGCGTTCSASFPSGSVVTLSGAPGSGSTFSSWSGGGCSGAGTCTVTVTAATTIIATFTAQSSNSPSISSVAGLVAAYSFSQGSGNTVTDLSGNNNTGMIAGATWSAAGRYVGAVPAAPAHHLSRPRR
jgi:Divergent InlB B-repeat domain